MEPIDHFVADVEASGEDKKHAPLGYIAPSHYAHIMSGENFAEDVRVFCERQPGDVAIYTQAQRDAYAAEAVQQERERIMGLIDERRKAACIGADKPDFDRCWLPDRYAARADELEELMHQLHKDQP